MGVQTSAQLGGTRGLMGSPVWGQADGHDAPVAAPQPKNSSTRPTSAGSGARGSPHDTLVTNPPCAHRGGCCHPPSPMPHPTLPRPSGGDAHPQFVLAVVGGSGPGGGFRGHPPPPTPPPEHPTQQPPAQPGMLLPAKGGSRAERGPGRGCWHRSRHPEDPHAFPRVSHPRGSPGTPPRVGERGLFETPTPPPRAPVLPTLNPVCQRPPKSLLKSAPAAGHAVSTRDPLTHPGPPPSPTRVPATHAAPYGHRGRPRRA